MLQSRNYAALTENYSLSCQPVSSIRLEVNLITAHGVTALGSSEVRQAGCLDVSCSHHVRHS